MNLSFLSKGVQYDAVIYYDDPSLQTVTKVGIKKIIVNSHSVIKREVLPENGLAVYISPVR
jgi:alpha-glucosidase